MNIKCGKINISNYSFLRLLSSSIIVNGNTLIIENHKLEKELYKFYDREEFNFLFEDIVRRKDIIKENSYVDLNCAFQQAYALGLLSQIHDSYSEMRSIINLSIEESQKIQSQYNTDQLNAINMLCTELFEDKYSTKNNKYDIFDTEEKDINSAIQSVKKLQKKLKN